MSNFVTFKTLSLKVADEIAALAVQTAQRNAFPPIAVCVMDVSGNPIVTKRMDSCPVSKVERKERCKDRQLRVCFMEHGQVTFVPTSPVNNNLLYTIFILQPSAFPRMAVLKASTCINMKMSTRAYGEKYLLKEGATPDAFCRLLNQMSAVPGDAIALPGGILLRSNDLAHSVLGAVGVSGAAAEEDEYVALRAVQLSTIAREVKVEPSWHSCSTIKEEKQ
jgi:uncharacterized protein GlcG (DUF336 family)